MPPREFSSASLCMAEACRGVLLTSGTPTTGPPRQHKTTSRGPEIQKNMREMFDQGFTLKKVKLKIMKSILYCVYFFKSYNCN